jgi:hypothetical protein
MLKQLSVDKLQNPKVFYKVAQQVSRMSKGGTLVKGFTENGEDIPL